MSDSPAPLVVVTGANGLVGARTCAALAERGARVRALVRRAGTAPALAGVEEHVGDFPAAEVSAAALAGSDAVVTTVHPMGSDRATQHRIGVEGTATVARAAADAGVARLVHVSTAAVYDRSPGDGAAGTYRDYAARDVAEDSPLVDDDGGDYPLTKRQAEEAIARVEGLTRVLVRPPAILGTGETSVWNTLRPAAIRDDEGARHAIADQTFAWVHVDDLAAALADLATGAITGPADGACTALTVAGEPATVRQYHEAVCRAVGVDPVWDDEPAWTGQLSTARARSWGWTPRVSLDAALAELVAGLRA